ncbi:MAG TPA: 1-acyl-sn-glycerol-3-phosphate acyltransferase [Firmicutes bacterium]|nr:1-acyl-sn-glycerol-3-phosphate acyltransferase [Bacillota bacterium]
MFYKIIRAIFRFLIVFLMPTKVIGGEKLDREGRYIFACNHQTYLDIPMLIAKCPRVINFMAKALFFEGRPVLGFFFRKMHAFPVHPASSDLKSLKHAIEVLNKDEVLGIFPQGRRVKESPVVKREEMYSGMAFIALKAKADIIPVMFMRPPLVLKRNVMKVGEPIKYEDYKDRRLKQDTLDEITDELCARMNSLLHEEEA